MRVLLIEDSSHLQRYVSIALKREGFAFDVASDGVDGLWHAQSFPYDVIVLDIMLPKMDGLSVLKQLRAEGNTTNILMLTAKSEVNDRVYGLQEGADDYLIKPFDMSELIARIQSLARRTYAHKSPTLSVGDLVIDTITKNVTVRGEELTLTRREYKTLEYLTIRSGEVVSRSDIEDHIYDMNDDIMSNAISSTISTVRKKLTALGAGELIQTRHGFGYIIESAAL